MRGYAEIGDFIVMKLTNKAGRQIGIPGNPALILDKDQTVSITGSQLKQFLRHQVVKLWFQDGELVVTKKGKVKQVVAPDEYIYRHRPIKPKPKRKRKPRIKMRTEPKFVDHRPQDIPTVDHEESGFDSWTHSQVKQTDCEDEEPDVEQTEYDRTNFDRWPPRWRERWRNGGTIAHIEDIYICGALGQPELDCFDRPNVPPDVLRTAIANDACVGIELLALGKPMGDIFNPEHWMYESTRDHFGSILVVDDNAVWA